MNNFTTLFILFSNCCLIPLLFFLAGWYLAKGMPGSPIAIVRRRNRRPIDDMDLDI